MKSDDPTKPFMSDLTAQGASTRCYVCGSSKVAAICHHCGRPMCSAHGPVHPHMRWFTENREFTNLSFDSWPLENNRPAHCADHVHSSPNYRRIMIFPGILILLIGLYFAIQGLSNLSNCLGRRPENIDPGPASLSEALRDPEAYVGIEDGMCYRPELSGHIWYLLQFGLIALFGATTAGVGAYLNRERIASDLAGWRPPVPLGPTSNCLEVVESLSAHLTLTPEGRTSLSDVQVDGGGLFAQLRLTPADKTRLEEYKSKYGVPSKEIVHYHAGFLMFEGQPHIEINHPPEKAPAANLIVLDGDVNEQPYLSGAVGSSNPVCLESLGYEIFLPEGKEENWLNLPLRLVPLFGENGNSRQLRLELQFNPGDFLYLPRVKPGTEKEGAVLSRDQLVSVEEIHVDFDAEDFGKPVSEGLVSEFRSVVNGQERPFYRVTWRGMWFQAGEEVSRIKLPPIRFSQAIPSNAKLLGSLRIRVPALRSGMKRVNYFSALGNPVGNSEYSDQPYPFQGSTVIHLKYDLALEKLQRTWWISLPKGQIPADISESIEIIRSPKLKYQVPLEPETIRGLLLKFGEFGDAHIDKHFNSLKRVVQDPPRTSDQDARRNRWYWNIRGRRYKNSLPIDFHLIVSGEDTSNNAMYREGFTEVEIMVQGQVYEYHGVDSDFLESRLTNNLRDLQDELQILEDQVNSFFTKLSEKSQGE